MNNRSSCPVFVSLTTISSRVAHLDLVISSLIAQDRKPDKIVLNISDKAFLLDDGVQFSDLPPLVRELSKSGEIEVRDVENIGSYRKLVPTLQRYHGANCVVVTADDDAAYPSGWLDGLLEAYEKWGCTSAYRCRTAPVRDGAIRPYFEWKMIEDPENEAQSKFYEKPHMMVFPTGRGGVLYHTSFFPDLSLLDELRICAPAQDDLAFRVAAILANVPVIAVPFVRSGATRNDFGGPPVTVELWKHNLPISDGMSENDKALKSILATCLKKNLLRGDEFV